MSRFGRKWILVMLATMFAVLGTLAVSPAAAQDGAAVEAELDRTDRRIEQAESAVNDADVPASRLELNEAIRIQANARLAFTQLHPRLALDLTFRARARADRAIALVEGLPDPDRVLAQLERTREVLERTRDRIEECNRDRPRALFATALEMQRRADDAARGGRYLAALQLTLGARERAQRALRLCNVQEDVRENAERALNRTDDALERARDAAGDHMGDRVKDALQRATAAQARARSEFQAQHFDVALRLTMSARTWAYRVVRWSSAR
jgi:hypothetical protein